MKTLDPPSEVAAGTEAPTATPKRHPHAASQTSGRKPVILTEDHPLADRIGTRRKEREAARLLSILDELEGRAG
jgi:hypothetical protein